MQRSRFLASSCIAAGAALAAPYAASAAAADRVAIVTDRGTIVVALDPARAPITTKNFLGYVNRKFYDGGTFFRAIPGFVIQGGNKDRERPTDAPIVLETPQKTGIRNTDGAISMARTQDPNSATSEFFICDGDQPNLDGSASSPGYAAFGHVVTGMPIVRAIARLPASDQMLITPVRILKISQLR